VVRSDRGLVQFVLEMGLGDLEHPVRGQVTWLSQLRCTRVGWLLLVEISGGFNVLSGSLATCGQITLGQTTSVWQN